MYFSLLCTYTDTYIIRILNNAHIYMGTYLYGTCRGTPVRHAANPYHQERHPDAQEKLKHYIISS